MEELRLFDGDIWAVNGAWSFLQSHGVDAWFMTVDPSEFVLDDAKDCSRAILAKTCHPKLFDLLKGRDVRVFDAQFGPTSVCEATMAAVEHGHRKVTFFGCEGSYDSHEKRHAYGETRLAETVVQLLVGGLWYTTQLDFIRQAETLAAILRAAPHVYSERSGGLLRALVEHGDYSDARIVTG